jgi:hypothetical protein
MKVDSDLRWSYGHGHWWGTQTAWLLLTVAVTAGQSHAGRHWWGAAWLSLAAVIMSPSQ